MDEKTFDTIIGYGEHYRQAYLVSKHSTEELLSDWWQGFLFFIGHIFYQGRRDSISTMVRKRAIGVLDLELSKVGRELRALDLDQVADELRQVIGRGKVGKEGDVKMTVDALSFVQRVPDFHIVAYSVERITKGDADRHYYELLDIYQVGPKVASFYLRDVVLLFGLEASVPDDLQFSLQPIDVWVRRLAVEQGLVSQGAPDEAIRRAIVALCRQRGGSPLLFNAGAWFAGSQKVGTLANSREGEE